MSYFDWLRGLVSDEDFQISRTFQGKLFLILAFPFSFLHFLSAIGFSNFPVVHFALSLLSFLPYFQVCPLFTPFSFLSFTCIPFSYASIFFLCSHFPFRVVLLSLMVDYSKIRYTSPSITFFFARLGALVDSCSDSLGAISSSDPYP